MCLSDQCTKAVIPRGFMEFHKKSSSTSIAPLRMSSVVSPSAALCESDAALVVLAAFFVALLVGWLRTVGGTDGRTDGECNAQTVGRTVGRTDRQKELSDQSRWTD